MAINQWWAGDGSERYWLEITNRDNIGEDLIAPKVDDAGHEYWSYGLVNHVRPGDLVFHWDKNHGPAIVGYSIVADAPRSSSITWKSRGSYGRSRSASGSEPAWLAPLGGYVPLNVPVTQEALRNLESQILRVRDQLERDFGRPIYFPYALSNKRPLRAAQGYLTKFPRGLVEAIPELRAARDLGRDGPEERQPEVSTPTTSNEVVNGGRLTDAKRKKAIEMYAVGRTMEVWGEDFQVEDVGLKKSWDITAIKGPREVHIEVKGSSGTRDAVDLTDGEVRHAEAYTETALVVVDQIKVSGDNNCSGGRVRTWRDWVPDRGVLVSTAYRYPLPAPPEQE